MVFSHWYFFRTINELFYYYLILIYMRLPARRFGRKDNTDGRY